MNMEKPIRKAVKCYLIKDEKENILDLKYRNNINSIIKNIIFDLGNVIINYNQKSIISNFTDKEDEIKGRKIIPNQIDDIKKLLEEFEILTKSFVNLILRVNQIENSLKLKGI